jgi:hypothetical protein
MEMASLEGAKLDQRLHINGALNWRFTLSTPFFAVDANYVRSYDALYCIARPEAGGKS